MFETLKEAGERESAGAMDGSSPSEFTEMNASEPGFDTPSFDAEVANGANDQDTVEFEAHDSYEDAPFHNHPRWKELMGRKKALEDELESLSGFTPVVERLKAMGIASAEEFDAAYAAEEQRQFEANLANAINAGVKNGTIAPAAARMQFQAALQQRHAYDINQQVRAAKQRFPEMDEEMVRQVAQASYGRPGFDLAALARQSHERNLAFLERRLAQYEADRAQTPSAPLSNERGALAPANGRLASRRSWEDLLGLTRLVKT